MTYLEGLLHRFQEYPRVPEVRHSTWDNNVVRERLTELGVSLCNVDQPLFHNSIKPSTHTTAPVGYVRLHGRNYQQWFSSKASVRDRYDYLYSTQELEPWADRVKTIAANTMDTYVITNNHNLGKALLTAHDISVLLGMTPPQLPETLTQHHRPPNCQT